MTTLTSAEIDYLQEQHLGRLATLDGRAALVVDDIVSTQPWRVRFLEIRGTAEAVGSDDASVIRIRPTRILSFGIEEPPGEPHQTKLSTRNLG
jgi:pyridoxamine 5'-phosphate oxidase family protein